MPKAQNLIGKRYGRLTVVSLAEPLITPKGYVIRRWNCICDCGGSSVTATHNLNAGIAKSCGCLCKEKISEKLTKHGKSETRIYSIWKGMRSRCKNEKAIGFKRYGGRGITICDEWDGADGVNNFYKWALENGYNDSLTIDRINNDGNYCPENCRWVSMTTQLNNKSDNAIIVINDKAHTIAEWARIAGVSWKTIKRRYAKYHLSGEILLSKSLKEIRTAHKVQSEKERELYATKV